MIVEVSIFTYWFLQLPSQNCRSRWWCWKW